MVPLLPCARAHRLSALPVYIIIYTQRNYYHNYYVYFLFFLGDRIRKVLGSALESALGTA